MSWLPGTFWWEQLSVELCFPTAPVMWGETLRASSVLAFWGFSGLQWWVLRRCQCKAVPRAFPSRAHCSPSLSTGWQCLPSATAARSCCCRSTHPSGEQQKTLGWRVPGCPVLPGAQGQPPGTALGGTGTWGAADWGWHLQLGTSSTSQDDSGQCCTSGWLLVTSPAMVPCLSAHPAAAHVPRVPLLPLLCCRCTSAGLGGRSALL